MHPISQSTAMPLELFEAVGAIDLACLSAHPHDLTVENLRRRGIDVLRVKWRAPEEPKRWFAFLRRRKAAENAGECELSFMDGQLRFAHGAAERNVPLDQIASVDRRALDAKKGAHIAIACAGEPLEIGDGLSDAALSWLTDRIVLEASGLAWKPLFNVGKRSTRATTNPDDERYRQWTKAHRRLMDVYLRQAEPKIADLRAAIEAKSVTSARAAAHWLKSSSAAVGAMQLSELCQRLEIDLDAKDFARSSNLAPHLFDEFAKVASAFRQMLDDGMSVESVVDAAERIETPNPDGALFGLTALLVDDSRVNQEIARECLLNAGCSVTLADDGLDAIAACEAQSFDVILMDCQMTGIDGLTATRAIRDAEMRIGRMPAPVIALTANALRDDRQICLAAGMNDYLSKPFIEADLIAMVARWTIERSPITRAEPVASPLVETISDAAA